MMGRFAEAEQLFPNTLSSLAIVATGGIILYQHPADMSSAGMPTQHRNPAVVCQKHHISELRCTCKSRNIVMKSM